ncbi:uncharacterized protein LOC143914816 isoform X2 [Arctopsyche grandis]|uniref:uncharacterized protein LOC143914816 isoform X2 n=2 Tax=Arctopsyche grandis TaxID=121162 RepID=UPI00406D753B
MPIFDKCCCFSLRTGNLIIGWLGLVFFICFGFSYKKGMSFRWGVHMCISVIGSITSASLIYAAVKTSKLMTIPWLLTVFLTLLYLIPTQLCLWYEIYLPKDMREFFFIHLLLVITSIAVVVLIFSWLLVLSLYQQIRIKERSNLQLQNAGIPLQTLPSSSSEVGDSLPNYSDVVKTNDQV